ncbi:MAG TPA: ethylbenzene dehydrogenase-related protein [Xanthobacteraceae bacterium]|nr:ethylbenzene dehydrogenase-related protein [Xanthobacteraceae bacterium]
MSEDQPAGHPRSPQHPAASAYIRNRRPAPPRSDIGTIILHWTTAAVFFVSLFTGIRIAADSLNAPVSNWLSPILPQGHILTWHFVAGLAMFFCASSYLVYLNRSGLVARNALLKLRILTIPEAGKLRLEAINVALHWFIYLVIAILTITGVFLYLGFGGWLVWVHSTAAFVGLAYAFVHVIAHYLQGGWWQLFRLFRPAKLVLTRAVRPFPLLIAIGLGIITVAALAALDWATRDTLIIGRTEVAPTLDGQITEEAWAKARPVSIRTQQGSNFEQDTGETTVEVRAVHDGQKVYFAFKWNDPTRSLRRLPLVKKRDGWHVVDDRAGRADVVDFYEDKLAVIFSDQPALGGGGVTALGPNPLPDDKPRPLNERGFHYTTDGSVVDLWQWKATRGGMLGRVDDQFIGPPYEPTQDDLAYKSRYQGGYWNDPGRAFYSYNYKPFAREYRGPVEVLRLPKDWKAAVAQLGNFDLNPTSSDDENSRWNMFESETEPYSKEADALIPIGAVMPGVLITGDYEGDRADIVGGSRWKDGYWILETARNLKTESKFDKSFLPGKDLYMWVAAFDHVQTRHTRHARPIRIKVQP